MKKVYGVIGDPIEHSLSPVMHNAAFEALGLDAIYLAFRVPPQNVGNAIRGAESLGFGGLNVTVPLKEAAMRFVRPDELSKRIGAINTINFEAPEGEPNAFNTDGIAAVRVLKENVGSLTKKSVLMLGAGGAAKAIAFYLRNEGARLVILNRTAKRAKELMERLLSSGGAGEVAWGGLEELQTRIKEADILINATSVGMYPNVEETLVTADLMHKDLVVFDVVYNPVETRLLREAKKAGVRHRIDGVKMLVYQGAEAFKIWTGISPPIDVMERAVRERLGGGMEK